MKRTENEAHDSDLVRLGALLAKGLDERHVWQPHELAALLQYQLAAAVEFDLAGSSETAATELTAAAAGEGLLLKSFGDLFLHPHPPLELLEMTQRFAKKHMRTDSPPLPRDVAGVLYFASLACAEVRLHTRITAQPTPKLRVAAKWALSRDWLVPGLRDLFDAWLKTLSAGQDPIP